MGNREDMSENGDPGVSIIELQEEFMQHLEMGGRRIRTLAIIATVAGAYFALSYFVQLVILPYALGVTKPHVNLVDPGLVAVGLASLAVSLLWCYAGVRDLLFQRRMAKRIREVRELQRKMGSEYGLEARTPTP